MIVDKSIDNGKAFDWGRTSKEYAKFRDIYPDKFYQKIVKRNLCIKGQKVLDLGTGTGVLPRNMNIKYIVSPTENIDFPDETFDVVTACQCFWYFDHKTVAPKLYNLLKKNGRLLVLYMAWLPFEDKIAGESERLVLKYSPDWSGARETVKPIDIPDCVYDFFEMISHEEYRINVPFTKETWHGRMKACRGVGASLSNEELTKWESEHLELLDKIAPDKFEVLHYCALAELKVKK